MKKTKTKMKAAGMKAAGIKAAGMKAAGSAAIAACIASGCAPERACPEDNIRIEMQDVISDAANYGVSGAANDGMSGATHDGMSGATHDGISGATSDAKSGATMRLEENIFHDRTYEDRTYEITLPLRYNDGKDIDHAVYEEAATRLSMHFGGVSRYNSTEGCWHDQDNSRLVCEDNIVLSTSRECGQRCTAEQHTADRKVIEDLAAEYCAKLGQSSVYVREIANGIDFVEASPEEEH